MKERSKAFLCSLSWFICGQSRVICANKHTCLSPVHPVKCMLQAEAGLQVAL